MSHVKTLAIVALATTIAACDDNPAAVADNPLTLQLQANWNSTASPVGSSTVGATLAVKQFRGFRNELTLTVTGVASRTYQWRIFRGDCATNTPAANASAPTGLQLFATVESYPDVSTDGGGAGTATRIIAGALDSLKSYSVRIRASQSATNWNGTNPISCGNLQRSPA